MPVKDRTEEFHQLRKMKGPLEKSPKHSKKLASLMKDVDEVDKQIAKLKTAVDKVETEQGQVTSDVNMSKAKLKLEAAERQAREALAQANKMLQKLGSEYTPAAEGGDNAHEPLLRIHDNHVKALTRRYIEQLNKLQSLQGEHMSKMKELVKKQLEACEDPNVEERLAKMEELENEQIFVDNIQVEMDDAVRSLDLCRAREAELLKMEGKIGTVRDLFQQVHTMVNQQGEQIDHIESNVEDASGKIIQGNKELVSARQKQRKARRCKIIIAVIIIVALLILTVVLVVQYA